MEKKIKSVPEGSAPQDPNTSPAKLAKKSKPAPQPKSNPKPDTYPAKENERGPGVKRKNLPHDPIKAGSKGKSK